MSSDVPRTKLELGITSKRAKGPLAALKAMMWMGPDGEIGQMAGRLIGVAVGLTYAHLAQADVSQVTQRLSNVRLLAYGYLAYLAVALTAVIRNGAVSKTVRYANTFADVNAVTAALYLGDAQVAPGVIYYLWAMAGNGFRYGAKYLYFGQILAIIGFTALLFVSDYWSSNQIGGLVIIVGCLLFLPLDFSVILEKIEDAKEAAESANRAKSTFLAVVSHEMRTPLSGILGIVELIRRTRIDVEQRTLLDTLARSADVLLHLVTNVLDLAKIEAGKMPVHPTRFNYSDLAAAAVELFRFEASQRNIALRVQQASSESVTLTTDPSIVRQILLNLVGNAVKFTEHGSVEIRVSPLERSGQRVVRTEIHDTGIGIPEEFRDRLFDAFTQADQSSARRYGGTGLGTTISQQLVRLLGGSIGFTSTRGVGSVFWFELPVTDGGNPSEVEAEGHGQATHMDWVPGVVSRIAPRLNILIVEDNETNRFVLSRMLTDAGHTIHTEADGFAALSTLQGRSFDVALVDMEMPGLSGTDVIARYRAAHPGQQTPTFIMLTAYATSDVRDAALRSGASSFLTKPVTGEQLLGAITAVTHRQRPDLAEGHPEAASAKASVLARARMLRDDPLFCDGLFDAFLTDARATLPKLERAILDLRWPEIAQHAHALRGSAVDAGVRSIADACRNIEQLVAAKAVEPLRNAWRDLQLETTRIEGLAAAKPK